MVQERSMQEMVISSLRDPKTRYTLIGVGVLMLGAAGYYGFNWYRDQNRQQAHRQFSEGVEEYKKALHKPSLWSEVEDIFELARTQNKGSALEPFFMWHQAQALMSQGKRDQALILMKEALAVTPKTSALLPLMQTIYALARIDAGQAPEGVADLEKLAGDVNNPYRDMALFYTGEYYQMNGNSEQARKLWGELLEAFPVSEAKGFKKDRNASPWSALVPESMRSSKSSK